MSEIKTAAIVGTGVIGAGWAARFLAHGLDVVAWDPAPEAEEKLRAAVDNAWPAVSKVGLFPGADRARLSFAASLEELSATADFVQENAPEREDLKKDLLAQIDAAAKPEAIIASSTSGYMPTDLQSRCQRHPERVLVGHPFNPVYLLPLVEIVGGEKTAPEASERASRFYEAMGMHALNVKTAPGERGRGDHRGARRCHRLRAGTALGHLGYLPAIPPGRRGRRHAPLPGTLRRVPEGALD
jgi:carnitine 3-dehydrogenase